MTGTIGRAIKSSIKKSPAIASVARRAIQEVEMVRHSVLHTFPALIRPRGRKITIAVTAKCNARCIGCRYGRDFMLGECLPFGMVSEALEDAKECGFDVVRLYGGEPLLHKDLPRMVGRCQELGLKPYAPAATQLPPPVATPNSSR